MSENRKALLIFSLVSVVGLVILLGIVLHLSAISRIQDAFLNAEYVAIASPDAVAYWGPDEGMVTLSVGAAYIPIAIDMIPKDSDIQVFSCDTYDNKNLSEYMVAWETRNEELGKCRFTDFLILVTLWPEGSNPNKE